MPRLPRPALLSLAAAALTGLVVAGLGLPAGPTARAETPKKPKPARPAPQYTMHDTHDTEHVTIAADPADNPRIVPDTRLDYLRAGIMPIRVIVTNDSDQAVTLDDARIDFIAGDNSVVHAATDAELERRLFTLKSATGTRLPLPIPVTVGNQHVNKKILEDENDFGFQTTTIAPHTTAAGYLFYDTRDTDAPFLNHATLELRKVRFAGTNKALDSFEIPLHPTDETPDDKRDAKP